MNLPPWIAALALVFWGFETGALLLSAGMAGVVLGPQVVPHRFKIGQAEFHRACEVCWVLGLGGILLFYSRETVGNVLRSFAAWLPAFALPALLAQLWSVSGRMPTSALIPLPFWRRRDPADNPGLDLGPAFVAFCVLSASTAGGGRAWYYPGLLVVLGGMLWMRRASGGRRWSAGLHLILAGAGGWFVALGLAIFQQWVEAGMIEWTARFQRSSELHRESRTAIGRVGRVGGSSTIILRYREEGGLPLPPLLRIATYTDWGMGTWYAPRGDFEKVEGALDRWDLTESTRASVSGLAHMEWVRGATRGLVPLPSSVRALQDLAAESVDRTPAGTVRAIISAGVVSLRAQYGNSSAWEAHPSVEEATTNAIPSTERRTVLEVSRSLGLVPGISSAEARRIIANYFQENFRYTTDLIDTPSTNPLATTPLGHFLLGHRTGHCEYFATAATLMLRAAGIPARYSTGYRADSNERDGEYLLVRESAGHAWVRIWNGETWEDFDPTPASDFEEEHARTLWGRMSRSWSQIRFSIARWWWLAEKQVLRQAYWLSVPLLIGLLWRFRSLRSAGGSARPTESEKAARWPGLDSEWLPVEALLAREGWTRRDLESPREWLARLRDSGWNPSTLDFMREAQQLHLRLRFDPRGLSGEERNLLRTCSEQVLQAMPKSRDAIDARELSPVAG